MELRRRVGGTEETRLDGELSSSHLTDLHVQHVRFNEEMAHVASRGVRMEHLNWTSFSSHGSMLELCAVRKAKV